MGRQNPCHFRIISQSFEEKRYGEVFKQLPRWRRRLPADLGRIVCGGLNDALGNDRTSNYMYEGLERLQKEIMKIELIQKYLLDESADQQRVDKGRP